MQQIRKFCFLVIVIHTFGFSCNDDPAIKSHNELLVGKWKRSASYLTVPGGNPSNVFDDMEACQQDNLTEFNSDGTYTVVEGETTCPGTNPDVLDEGTW